MLYGHVLQPCIRNSEWFEIRKSLSTAVSNAKAREVVGNRAKWVEKAREKKRFFSWDQNMCERLWPTNWCRTPGTQHDIDQRSILRIVYSVDLRWGLEDILIAINLSPPSPALTSPLSYLFKKYVRVEDHDCFDTVMQLTPMSVHHVKYALAYKGC